MPRQPFCLRRPRPVPRLFQTARRYTVDVKSAKLNRALLLTSVVSLAIPDHVAAPVWLACGSALHVSKLSSHAVRRLYVLSQHHCPA